MRLVVPTGWDDRLVDELAGLPIDHYYGKLRADAIGGGRAASQLRRVTRSRAAAHVRRIHERGGTFHYVLNGVCLGNQEYRTAKRRGIFELLDWLAEIQVDGVIVALPFLLEWVKKHHPAFKTSVSVFSHVDTINMARRFEDMGADAITVPQAFNRDFRFLRALRRLCRADLVLLANNACLYGCPFRRYHSAEASHASQTGGAGLPSAYLAVRCTQMRCQAPAELIRSTWIRPEDLHVYEELGLDLFKLAGRQRDTGWIVGAARAYASRRGPANLGELLTRPQATGARRGVARGAPPRDFIIDNARLDGFLGGFKDKSCAYLSCKTCRYCDRVAAKAVRADRGTTRAMARACERTLRKLTARGGRS